MLKLFTEAENVTEHYPGLKYTDEILVKYITERFGDRVQDIITLLASKLKVYSVDVENITGKPNSVLIVKYESPEGHEQGRFVFIPTKITNFYRYDGSLWLSIDRFVDSYDEHEDGTDYNLILSKDSAGYYGAFKYLVDYLSMDVAAMLDALTRRDV